MIREMYIGSHGMFWPKGDVAEHREVKWKSEKGETVGIRSKTKKPLKDHFAASLTVSFIP